MRDGLPASASERDELVRRFIEQLITHYDFQRVYLSQFFPVESAWWRLRLLER